MITHQTYEFMVVYNKISIFRPYINTYVKWRGVYVIDTKLLNNHNIAFIIIRWRITLKNCLLQLYQATNETLVLRRCLTIMIA